MLDLLSERPDMSIFVRAVEAAGMKEELSSELRGRRGEHSALLAGQLADRRAWAGAAGGVPVPAALRWGVVHPTSRPSCSLLFPCSLDPAFVGTVFAPSNCAFKYLLADLDVTEKLLMSQRALLDALLAVSHPLHA